VGNSAGHSNTSVSNSAASNSGTLAPFGFFSVVAVVIFITTVVVLRFVVK